MPYLPWVTWMSQWIVGTVDKLLENIQVCSLSYYNNKPLYLNKKLHRMTYASCLLRFISRSYAVDVFSAALCTAAVVCCLCASFSTGVWT